MTKKPWDEGSGDEGQSEQESTADPVALQAKVDELQSKISKMEGTITGKDGYIKQLGTKYDALKSEYDSKATEFEGQLAELRTAKQQLEDTFKNADTELATIREERDRLKTEKTVLTVVKRFAEANKIPKLVDFVDDITPIISQLPEETAQVEYLTRFAQKLGLPTDPNYIPPTDPLSGATPPMPAGGTMAGRTSVDIGRELSAMQNKRDPKYAALNKEYLEALDREGIK